MNGTERTENSVTSTTENSTSGFEEFIFQGKLFAQIIRAEYRRKGIIFFTDPNLSQQMAQMERPKGYEIDPHFHLPVQREVFLTREALIVRRGKILVVFYNDEKEAVGQTIIKRGDILLLIDGGHGFTFLKNGNMAEIKQGPYAGDRDKERFEKPRD